MRVMCGRRVRVGPGDQLVAAARLPHESKLGRLYVFARVLGDDGFSPYVPNLSDLVDTRQPAMQSPKSMRLTSAEPQRQLVFTSDIDGWFQMMQEVDTAKDKRCEIKWKRIVCPQTSWRERIAHRLRGWLALIPDVRTMVNHG
jgi:hypothetical protein